MADHAIIFRAAEGRARAATLFLWASIVTSALATAGAVWDYHLWGRIGTGIGASMEEIRLKDDVSLLLGGLDLAVFLGAAVTFLMWFHRVFVNLPALGIKDARWSAGWAVAGWFVPIMSFFLPYQVASDIWQASDPTATTDYWRTRPLKPLLNRWWGFFVAWMVVEWMAFCAWTRVDCLDESR